MQKWYMLDLGSLWTWISLNLSSEFISYDFHVRFVKTIYVAESHFQLYNHTASEPAQHSGIEQKPHKPATCFMLIYLES